MKPRRSDATRWLAVPLAVLVALGAVAGPAAAAKKPKKDDKAAAATAKGEDKPFDEVVKDMEVHEGLFRVYTKADENKMLIELMPDQLDAMFLFSPTLDQAVGERGFYGAQVLQEFPIVFHRVGKSIQWVQKNTMYKADPETPAGRAAARSFADGILGSAKIQSKPHAERKSLLVDAADLFATDLPGAGRTLGVVYGRSTFRFDKERSGPLAVKTFPKNVLFDVRLHFTTDDPKAFSATLPDPRSVPLLVKYDFSPLVSTGYLPRIADDRLGHFHTVQQDFRSDHAADPYLRYITRWKLEKADPSQALSPPKEPIVYWLENTIPVEYRAAITEGALLWNKAFEKIGFKDAVVVKQQPDSADWDPADARYNTIRWFAGVDAFFAIGPSRIDPFTGQIYDADIGIAEGIIRNARRTAEEFVGPSTPTASHWLGDDWGRGLNTLCTYAGGLAEQAAFGATVLEARGSFSPEMEQKLMHQYILELTAHEVGHTLGLRHNFRASVILPASALNDVQKTQALGMSSSVMDYNPIVIASKGETQGDFVTMTLGPYDYWAIEYAYTPIGGDETPALAKIAARASTDPMLPYSTDEDALGTYSPRSIDPLANQYDMSTDPLEYFGARVAIVEELWRSLDHNVVKTGEGYQVLRRSLGRGVNEYTRAMLTSSKLIGGVYHYRDHAGDPNGRTPYVPVPAAKEREALAFLTAHAFSDRAFQLPASVLNRLAIDRLPTLDGPGYFGVMRLDYPWHDVVLNLQRRVMARLYDPVTLGRVLDNEMRFAPGETPFRMVDLFSGLSNACWSELDKPAGGISSLRRNLQREHVRQLVVLLLRQDGDAAGAGAGAGAVAPPPPPADATTLARASLIRIRERIKSALASPAFTDATSRAHLQETDARIAAAFNAQLTLGLN